MPDSESQLTRFIDKFEPDMQARIRACRAKLKARLPAAVELVYDNYNFLVIGFGPTHRPSDAIFSLAAQKRGVNLCFLRHGPELPDPQSALRGTGKKVRNVPLVTADDLDLPVITELMDAALAMASVPIDASVGPELVIQSVSQRQRPRR